MRRPIGSIASARSRRRHESSRQEDDYLRIDAYSAVSNFVCKNMPNAQTTPDRVIARSEATWQSMRLRGLLHCARNDDGFDLRVL
jgi:hypothetical protein